MSDRWSFFISCMDDSKWVSLCLKTTRKSLVLVLLHCSKSSFFVQKFNFNFPRKLSIFLGVKISWKCCGFGLCSCWQHWFHEKNCEKKKNEWKTRKTREKFIWGSEYFFFEIIRQIESSLVLCSLNVNRGSRFFFQNFENFYFGKKSPK